MKNAAQRCNDQDKDENAWSADVAKPVFDWETWGPDHEPTVLKFSKAEHM